MSLESQVLDLTNEVRGFTNTVMQQIPDIRAQQNSFINNWGIDGYTVLSVGAGKQFASIQAAYDSLLGKTLKQDVMIKVDDGTYNLSVLNLYAHPYSHRINIEGNSTNPANCVLNFIPTAGLSHGVLFDNVRNIGFSGFKLVGQTNVGTNFTYRAMRLGGNSIVYVKDQSLMIDGVYNGIEVAQCSILYARKTRITNFGGYGVVLDGASRAGMEDSVVSGRGATAVTTNTSGAQTKGMGFYAVDNSCLWLGSATVIDNVSKGIFANNNSYVYGSNTAISNVGLGVYAEMGAALILSAAKIVTAAEKGVFATLRAVLYLDGIKIESAPIGVESSLGATVNANSGYAKNCTTGYIAGSFGQIDAYNTSANSTGTTTKYSPATSDALGNGNGMVRFS